MRPGVLRKKYPKFIYRNYSYKVIGEDLKISFLFEIPPDIIFRPQLVIKNAKRSVLPALDNLIFHVGLMEILSYWKATCSPEIIIEAGYLDKEQIKWWHDLIIKGMGQFFYQNKIDWRPINFLKVSSFADARHPQTLRTPDVRKLKDRYLVPFAGGRDSIVTLESLKKKNKETILFTVNPIAKIQKTVKVSGIKKQIIVRRTVDRKLLELNKKGYLNGHTPFTGLLSFISVLCAVLFDYKNIAFSNEKSANEGNVKYLGRVINHQWAKSSEFEKMFRYYCKKYLAKNLNYFSFTRKYGELEISKIMAKYPKYFPVFSSCNADLRIVGSPSTRLGAKRWCGKCPKCLFVYMSLYPFLEKSDLLKIFGKDLFQDKNLLPIMKQLMAAPLRVASLALSGRGDITYKPFECVGTYKESRKAFELSLKKALRHAQGKIPFLLKIKEASSFVN